MEDLTKQREQAQTQKAKEQEQVQTGSVTRRFNFSMAELNDARETSASAQITGISGDV